MRECACVRECEWSEWDLENLKCDFGWANKCYENKLCKAAEDEVKMLIFETKQTHTHRHTYKAKEAVKSSLSFCLGFASDTYVFIYFLPLYMSICTFKICMFIYVHKKCIRLLMHIRSLHETFVFACSELRLLSSSNKNNIYLN